MPNIEQTVAANLPRRTGVTLREWVMLLRMNGPEKRDDQVSWLKRTYGLGAVQASVIVEHASRVSGPVADKLLNAAQSLGVDVRVEPKKSYVPFIRHSEFAVVRRTANDHLDLGLALPGTKIAGRLVPVRKSDAQTRITHHVEIARSEEVDAEVIAWLRKAYELDA